MKPHVCWIWGFREKQEMKQIEKESLERPLYFLSKAGFWIQLKVSQSLESWFHLLGCLGPAFPGKISLHVPSKRSPKWVFILLFLRQDCHLLKKLRRSLVSPVTNLLSEILITLLLREWLKSSFENGRPTSVDFNWGHGFLDYCEIARIVLDKFVCLKNSIRYGSDLTLFVLLNSKDFWTNTATRLTRASAMWPLRNSCAGDRSSSRHIEFDILVSDFLRNGLEQVGKMLCWGWIADR